MSDVAPMKSLVRIFSLAIVGVLFAGCASVPEYRLNNAQVERAIQNWLSCDECADDQLHHVVIAGKDAQNILNAYIANPDRDGSMGAYETQLLTQHAGMLVAHPTLAITAQRWAEVHVQARLNRIKARAAHALHLIDSGELSRTELSRHRRIR